MSRESDRFALGPKVEALIRSYEAELADGDRLDRTALVSLREDFLDTFLALETGPADLRLRAEDFPRGLTNLQCKMVIAQALDEDGKGVPGVTLEIRQPEAGFHQRRVTRADGFSEDLDAAPPMLPPDQRFPMVGTWQINLPDRAQFAQLSDGDLYLFFMYTYEAV